MISLNLSLATLISFYTCQLWLNRSLDAKAPLFATITITVSGFEQKKHGDGVELSLMKQSLPDSEYRSQWGMRARIS